MKVLRVLIALAGVVSASVGLFLFVVQSQAAECEFPCNDSNVFEDSLLPAIWMCIALVLWMLAGFLSWMEKRFDRLSI